VPGGQALELAGHEKEKEISGAGDVQSIGLASRYGAAGLSPGAKEILLRRNGQHCLLIREQELVKLRNDLDFFRQRLGVAGGPASFLNEPSQGSQVNLLLEEEDL